MIGWIILGLLVLGISIFIWSLMGDGRGMAEDQLSRALIGFLGLVIAGVGLLILIVMGILNLIGLL